MGYLTAYERCKIETMLQDGISQREIARRLGRHYNTINYEIKKGRVELLNTDLTTRLQYCSDVGQRVHMDNCRNKGRELKIGNDMAFVKYVEKMILKERYSPYALLVRAKGCFKTDICVTTLYTYIDRGIFLNVTNKDLPYKPNKKRKYDKVKRISYKKPDAKSIEERAEEANERAVYGHWEGDTVVGKNQKGDGCLLVLTERKTREEIIMKMTDKNSACVVSALDYLERAYGALEFRRIFKSITFDNGPEFANTSGIEKDSRTVAYYAHPYCPSERGSNENQNKLIRRWSPKGASMRDISNMDACLIAEWVNNYPRRLFDGLSSAEYSNMLI